MRARLIAAGDNLIHKELYRAARLRDGGYLFDSLFENISDTVRSADIAALNQETILVQDAKRVSSFPSFGSPTEVGEAAVRAGFNVITHASNHALDKGLSGVRDSIAFWRTQKNVTMLGLHSSSADAKRIAVREVNGIRVAMLNYTEKLNFRPLPPFAPYCVDVMKKWRRNTIRTQIERARELSDFVVVFPHWGCEYLYEPISSQREWARFLAEAGADIIIGTHPHVVQPAERISCAGGRRTLCFYSLGNFVSCQVKAGTMLGAMADIEIEKRDGAAFISAHRLLPIVTHTDEKYSHFTEYPLERYTDALCAENKIFKIVGERYGVDVNLEYLNGLFGDILSGKAQAKNEFQSPRDVTRSNIRGVFNALIGRNTKK